MRNYVPTYSWCSYIVHIIGRTVHGMTKTCSCCARQLCQNRQACFQLTCLNGGSLDTDTAPLDYYLLLISL